MIEFVVFFIWINNLITTKCFSKTLPLKFRLQHILFSFFLFGVNTSLSSIGWLIFSFDEKASNYFYPISFINANINGMFRISSLIIDLFLFFTMLLIMKGNESARKFLIIVLPISLIISPVLSLSGYVQDRTDLIGNNETILFLVISFFVFAILHFWVFRFYNSQKYQEYLKF